MNTMASSKEINLEQLQHEIQHKINDSNNIEQLDEIRVQYLGKAGVITGLMKDLRNLDGQEKKERATVCNKLRNAIEGAVQDKRKVLAALALQQRLINERDDVTLESRNECNMHSYGIHPTTQVSAELIAIMNTMGFEFADGNHIEDDYHNFDALNIPAYHPARQEHDTFYVDSRLYDPVAQNMQTDAKIRDPMLLRTHTSTTQVRIMKGGQPPFKFSSLGRVFRCDYDATHTPVFHQIEGVYIDRDVNMGHLKWCLLELLKKFFAVDDIAIKLRPSYFPFTEPSVEIDIGYSRDKNGRIAITGKGEHWLEILGGGMVHPNVLRNCGICSETYQGFAFGIGVERLAMLKYGMNDLRAFYEGDVRWLNHYNFGFTRNHK